MYNLLFTSNKALRPLGGWVVDWCLPWQHSFDAQSVEPWELGHKGEVHICGIIKPGKINHMQIAFCGNFGCLLQFFWIRKCVIYWWKALENSLPTIYCIPPNSKKRNTNKQSMFLHMICICKFSLQVQFRWYIELPKEIMCSFSLFFFQVLS
jgi:hypothetical protein